MQRQNGGQAEIETDLDEVEVDLGQKKVAINFPVPERHASVFAILHSFNVLHCILYPLCCIRYPANLKKSSISLQPDCIHVIILLLCIT